MAADEPTMNSGVEHRSSESQDEVLQKHSILSIEAIRQYIQSDLLNDTTIRIDSGQDMLLSGMLDSLNIIRLVTHIESECKITIPPEDVVLENFNSLNDIARYIRSRGVSTD